MPKIKVLPNLFTVWRDFFTYGKCVVFTYIISRMGG